MKTSHPLFRDPVRSRMAYGVPRSAAALAACLLLAGICPGVGADVRIPGPRVLQKSPKAAAPVAEFAPSQNQTATTQSPGPQTPGGPLTSVATSWDGIGSTGNIEPPDPSGAAGPNGILASVNLSIAYFDKTGNPIWGPIPHTAFFQAPGTVAGNLLGDPHTLYDPGSGRFFTHVLELDFNGSQSHLALAVSKNSNPTTSGSADWYFYRIDDLEPAAGGGPTAFTDYPGDGFDGQCYYVTFNMFTFPIQSASFTNALIIALDKNALINGNTNYTFTYVDGFTLQPCSVLSTNTPGNVALFAESLFFVDQRHVRISVLTDPLGAHTLTSTLVSVPDNGSFPPFSGAPQAGTGIPIDTLDGRAEGNAFYYNGNVWFCHTAGGDFGKASVYYYNVALNGYPSGTPSLVEEGSIDGGPGEWTYQPNIGCNALGDVGMVYCQSSASRYPTIMATTRKAGALAFDTPLEIKASPSFYFGGRWGDFASVTADPVDNSFWMTHEWSRSSQLADWGTWWANVIPKTAPDLVVYTNFLTGGNGNGFIDPNECNDLTIVLTNTGSLGATNVSATISTTNAGVIVAQRASFYPDMPILAGATNFVPFKISTSPAFICGTPVFISMVVKCDSATRTNVLRFDTGTNNLPLRFNSTFPVSIPDNNPAGASSPIVVSNITGTLGKVTLGLYITHTFDSDLLLELIAPDGTTNILSANNGFSGNNYGAGCSPDSFRTTFDDAASNSITLGAPPFIGTWKPQQPLSVYAGKSGTNVNGVWQLHVIDQAFIDVGTIQCWSLFLSSVSCVDGGGQCPGVDLSIGMISAPEPTFIGPSNLTYTITVTNAGPDTAKNAVISQVLPAGVVFVSAAVSQGSISQGGGVVTANLGNLLPGARATATVLVTAPIAGTLSSTASITSNNNDFDLSNNSVTTISHVNPPFSDVVAGLVGIPNPVLVGQTLTYTGSVTNNGPATASNVTLSNALPATVGVLGAAASQGVVTINGNVVIANFGSLTNGGRASVSIQVVPLIEGTITASTTASANQVDPVPGNNSASADTVVGASADLAVGLFANPASIVPGTNLTYTLRVTNRGPSIATAVIINDSLPDNVSVISTNSTKGSVVVSNSLVTASIPQLTNGEVVVVTIGVTTTNVSFGTLSDSATVSAVEADANTANNSASINVVVAPPNVRFALDRARINSENIFPTNGTVDPGETVNVSFFIQNNGNVPNTGSGLLVTLLATNGVTSPSGPQNYGNIAPSGVQNRAFTFTADGTNGGTIVATFLLQDPSTNQILTYTFFLPRTQTFANTNRIDIPSASQNQQQPGPAAPYPSSIAVSGVTGLVNKVTVTLSNLNHTFPHDINLLLVGPTGIKTLLLSDAADASSVSAADITFDDNAPSPLPAVGEISSGSWQPSAYDPAPAFSSPAPSGSYGTTLAAYNAPDPNGSWSLFANDDSSGDFGNIAGGWSITFSTVIPVNQVADLIVSGASSISTLFAGDTVTNTFTVTNSGPNSVVNVSFSSVLPAGASFVSATNSTGSTITLNSGALSCSLGSLAAGGAAATVSVAFIPNSGGLFTNTATAAAISGEVDLTLANNSVAQVVTVVQPYADLSVSSVATPNPVTIGSNLLVSVAVTNNGPNNALNVLVSNALPAGASLVASNSSQGSVATQGSSLVATLGTIAPSNWAIINFTLVPNSQGQLTNIARLATTSADTNAANNSSTVITTVVKPLPLILAARATLLSESFSPANATVDAGETVSVSFSLTNAGVAGSTNLTATLLAINGVNSPSGAQNYGTVLPGGTAARSFTFTAGASSPILATLQLSDAGGYSNQVTFAFSLPGTTSFTNSLAIIIPDHGPAAPYPSTISVSGLTGVVDKVTVSLNGLTHSFPDDLDIMLVSPSGQRVMLMSDCGGGHSITNVNLTIADAAASNLPDSAQIVSGTFKPTDFEPGDTFPSLAAAPVSTALASLNGITPNGNWSLYVVDDSVGDAGSISGGWSISITTISPVNPAVNLVLNLSAAPNPILVGNTLTYTFALTNRGPNTATNVVITDTLPAGLTVISSNSSVGSVIIGGTTVIITNISLAPSAGLSATLRVTPSAAGNIVNTATATSAQTDLDIPSNTAQATTTVVAPLRAKLEILPAANSQFQITLTGDAGLVYSLQGSSNLVNWVPVFTGTAAPNGTFKFTTTNGASFNYRFFRSVRLP